MPILKRIIIIAILFVALILISFKVLFYIVMSDHIERRESISRNEATNTIGFPLVNSATNIFIFTDVGGLQWLDAYMRLTVAKHDITNQINLIIASDNSNSNRPVHYERKNIDLSEIPSPSFDLHWWNKPIYWWTPREITNGYYIGAEKSYSYHIWVDENSGTLFIQEND